MISTALCVSGSLVCCFQSFPGRGQARFPQLVRSFLCYGFSGVSATHKHLGAIRTRMSGGQDSMTSQESVPMQNNGVETKSVNVIIKGTVQGVFYRNWTVENAKKLYLKGWVRNCRDGSVEAVFSGPSSAVDNMIEKSLGTIKCQGLWSDCQQVGQRDS